MPGWINADLRPWPGVDVVGDIREGLALRSDSLDRIVSTHALQELPYRDLLPALRELHRLLRPGGVLRLGLPDFDRAIEAYRCRDRAYFLVPDEEAASLGGKLVAHVMWCGATRTPLTPDFGEELLVRAGFRAVHRCAYRQTASPCPEITALDDRPLESFFLEASK